MGIESINMSNGAERVDSQFVNALSDNSANSNQSWSRFKTMVESDGSCCFEQSISDDPDVQALMDRLFSNDKTTEGSGREDYINCEDGSCGDVDGVDLECEDGSCGDVGGVDLECEDGSCGDLGGVDVECEDGSCGDLDSVNADSGSGDYDHLSNNEMLKVMGRELKSGNIELYKEMRESFLERVDGKIGQKIKHFDKVLGKMEGAPAGGRAQDDGAQGASPITGMNVPSEEGPDAMNTVENADPSNGVGNGANPTNPISVDGEGKALIVGIENDSEGSPCPGAEHDANTWSDTLSGYDQDVLIDQDATKEAIISSIEEAAAELEAGETFVFTYAGHGSQTGDANGDEADGMDEQIHVWDGALIDDEIWQALDQFDEGVNVVTVMDSCSADTNTDIGNAGADNANFVAISGSAADDYSYGDDSGGVMTNAFADALSSGSYSNYSDLFADVNDEVISYGDGQTPTLETAGPNGDALASQKPFVHA